MQSVALWFLSEAGKPASPSESTMTFLRGFESRSSALAAVITRLCSTKLSVSMFSVQRNPWRKPSVALSAKRFAAPPSSSRGKGALPRQRWAELLFPANASRHLHHHEQREDRANRHRQSREPFKEKRIREQHQVDQLRQSSLYHGKSQVHYQAQIADHQHHGNYRRNQERRMDRNVVRQVRQQQMECKERARQEKVIHRVQIVAAQRGQYEHQEEKEEQRHGSKIADAPRQRAGLQLLRHLQRDVESGHQILVIPFQLPAVGRLSFFRRRKRIVWEIETVKIRFHQQMEIVRLRDFL